MAEMPPPAEMPTATTPVESPPAIQPPPQDNFAEFWTDLYQHGAYYKVVFTLAEARALHRVALRPMNQEMEQTQEEGQP
jgi:hypothetical protein